MPAGAPYGTVTIACAPGCFARLAACVAALMVPARPAFGDLLRRRGYRNVFAHHPERYPRVDLAEIDRSDVDLVLLPDEPYVFTQVDGPEAFTTARTTLVSGRLLTWYGPSLLDAATFTA